MVLDQETLPHLGKKFLVIEERRGERLYRHDEIVMSLGRKYKIPSKPGFNPIFSKPDLRVKQSNLLLLGKKNFYLNPRLGISIKKKDYNSAVHRNYLKREIKQSFKNALQKLPCYDYVVVVGCGKMNQAKALKKHLNLLWGSCKQDLL